MSIAPPEVAPNRKGLVLGRWRLPFYYGWAIVATVFIAQFMASGMGGVTIGLFFKPISDDLGWSLTMMTGAVTAASIANMMIAPVIGPMLDRAGPRPVMVAGALFAGAGLLALTSVREIWQFWVLYALTGSLGLGEMGHFTGPVTVSKWFVRMRGRAMATATMGVSVGGVVLSPILGILIGVVGWRHTWAIMGIATVVVMVPIILIFMRRRPEDLGLLPDGATPGTEASAAGRAAAAKAEGTWTLKEAFGTRSFWLLIVTLNLVSLSASAGLLHLVPYLTKQVGMSTAAASFVLSARLAGSSLGRMPWGFIMERVPVRICMALVVFGRSIGTVLLVLAPFPVNIVLFVVIGGVIGGNLALVQPMIFSTYYGRRFTGSIQGTIQPLLGISNLVAPLVIARVYDVTGSFNNAFLFTAIVGFVATGFAIMATPPVKKTPLPVAGP